MADQDEDLDVFEIEDEILDIIDDREDEAGDENEELDDTASTSAASLLGEQDDFTVLLMVKGNKFVLQDALNGTCVACKGTIKTKNRGSNLTKHLVRYSNEEIVSDSQCFHILEKLSS